MLSREVISAPPKAIGGLGVHKLYLTKFALHAKRILYVLVMLILFGIV